MAKAPFGVTISVENLSGDEDTEFAAAASAFLEKLQGVDELEVEVPQRAEPGTRGLIAILSAIVVWGAKIGAFKAIYTLTRDFLDRYRNAEAVLKFRDGSTLKLKGLSREEAKRRMEEHLRRTAEKA